MSAESGPIFIDVDASDWPHLGGYTTPIAKRCRLETSDF